MERLERAVWVLVASLLVFDLVSRVAPNAEADALNALKTNLSDPNNILQSWNLTSLTDPTLDNPCAWSHVTCNGESSITRVTLGNANLSGQLVPQLGQLSNLQYLELYGNNISGRIPEELGNLTNLVSLGLHLNSLDGVIPPTLGKLSRLRFLRLNNNILSGRIPMSLTDIMSLQVLDLSNNQLTGNIPFGSFSSFSPISFANNSFIYPPPSPPLPIQSIPPATSPVLGSFTEAIAGEVAAGAALLFAALAIALSYWRRRKPQDHFFDVPAEEDPEVHLGQLKRFSLRELQVATDNFSNKNILGRGGFGKVYRGRLADGSLVAVKILKELRTHGGERQFQTEVEMINMAVHRNLLRLRGFCMTPTERLLIYPFMGNGSLASCVRDRPPTQPPLDWQIRRRIALGAARGLAYLHDHCDPKIIHRNVKASNIFLDEEFEAVVGDFGLAKLMDYKDTHIITNVCGTIGFMATEYLNNGKVSEKTDVFGYGVMLLELITGQRAFDLARLANGNDVWLLHWVTGLFKERKLEQLVDCDMDGNYIKEEVELLIQLALLCTQGSPTERPKMSDVVRMLNSASPEDFGTQGESQIFNFFSKIWCPSLQRTKGGRPGHPRSKPWLMLEGHGLAERWEEWQNTHPHHPSINWMVDSTSHI